jgi:hypothetical protein
MAVKTLDDVKGGQGGSTPNPWGETRCYCSIAECTPLRRTNIYTNHSHVNSLQAGLGLLGKMDGD